MPNDTAALIDIADQISTARHFAELIRQAHDRPSGAPTAMGAAHVSDLLQGVLDMLSRLIKPEPQEALK